MNMDIEYELTLVAGCIESNNSSESIDNCLKKFVPRLEKLNKVKLIYALYSTVSMKIGEEILLRLPFITEKLSHNDIMKIFEKFGNNWERIVNFISFLGAYRSFNSIQLFRDVCQSDETKNIVNNYFARFPKKLTFSNHNEWHLEFLGIHWEKK